MVLWYAIVTGDWDRSYGTYLGTGMVRMCVLSGMYVWGTRTLN